MTMGEASEAASAVTALSARLGSGDVDGAVALFADDCTCASTLEVAPIEGKQALAGYLRDYLAPWDGYREQLGAVAAEGASAAAQVQCEGIVRGSRVALDALRVVDVDDGGRIVRLRTYTDPAPLRA